MKLSELVCTVSRTGGVVEVGDAPDGLQGLPAGAAPPQPIGNDHVGLGEVPLDVAEVEGALVGAVRAEAVVHEGSTVVERPLRVDHRGQLLVLHLDERQRVLGEVAAVGDDHRDALADIADLVHGQAPPGVRGRVRTEVGQRVAQLGGLRAGDHRVHPRGGQRLDGVDGGDRRVRVRAPQDRGVKHAGQGHVTDVAPAPAQELRVLDAPDRLADPLAPFLVRADGRGCSVHLGGHRFASVGLVGSQGSSTRIRAAAAQTASVMNW